MPNFIDRTGLRYGRLTVLSRAFHERYTMFNCKCDCGTIKTIRGDSLSSGLTKSCGCLSVDTSREKATKHGLKVTPLYKVWKSIKARCYNSSSQNYKWYGGRGVRVCDEWKDNPNAFVDWALSNGYEPGLQIDKDKLGDGMVYSPENCCFMTPKENCKYRKPKGTYTKAINNKKQKTTILQRLATTEV